MRALSLGRVFDGRGFVLPVLGAAVLPFVIGTFGRHRSWPTAVTVSLSALALVLYVVYALEPSTTSTGAPLGTTWRTIGDHLDRGWHTLRAQQAPAPVTDGAVLIAVIVTWLVAVVSDWLAFVRRAVLGALAPALVLFVWSSTLGTKDDWELSAAAFLVLSGCFLYAQNLALLDRRRSWLVTRGATRAPSVVPTAVVAVVAVVAAIVLAPAVPGAGADPILDYNNAGGTRAGSNSYRASIAPLVDVGDKLRNIDIPDLFTVESARADYWRVTALDEYSADGGGQWTLNAAGEGKVKVGLPSAVPADAVKQVFTINRLGERWLPAAYRPVSITLDDTLVVVSSWTLVTSESSVEGLAYTVGSDIGPTAAQITAADQAATAGAVPKALAPYTALPPDFPSDITALAQEIVVKAGATTPFAKARALRDYFRNGSFVYDSNVDLGDDADAIATFLRQRRGFCVQFASAYAVMARSLGLPYAPGGRLHPRHEERRRLHRRITRRGTRGPRCGSPASGGRTCSIPHRRRTPLRPAPGAASLPSEIPLTITPGQAQPTATLPPANTTPSGTGVPTGTGASSGTGGTSPDGAGNSGSTAPTTRVAIPPSVSTTVESDNSVWALVALVAVGVMALVGVYVATVMLLKQRRRRARRHDDDPRSRSRVRGTKPSTASRKRGRAPIPRSHRWSSRVRPRRAPHPRPAARCARWRATYTTSRYGDLAPDPQDARQAWESVDELERALDERLSTRERWRRRLDPSTLRVPTGSRRD